MGVVSDLTTEVAEILKYRWTTRDGQVVPKPEDIKLSNDAVKLEGCVLYADLAESTQLVESEQPEFAAEIYKSYLLCATRIIRHYGGEITAFDGDRVMAVFIGNSKRNDATRAALAINQAVVQIINPAIGNQYPSKTYRVKHGVGIDSSDLFIARTGIRLNNDLVWVGRAANIAAKLCAKREGTKATWITEAVYDALEKTNRVSADGQEMWVKEWWPERSQYVYSSTWYWAAG